MRLCVAQTRPVTGSIKSNIDKHKALIASACSQQPNAIIFPELSLVGYEPTLASTLVCDPDDSHFQALQRLVDDMDVTVGVGMPTRNPNGICISMVLFRPHQPKLIYSKKYLHTDEEEFFISGENLSVLAVNDVRVAPAICYEISVPEHAENAIANGANLYVASVNKAVTNIDRALARLAEIARRYSIPVLMSNCVGFCDGFACAGRTSVWDSKGALIGQLDDKSEGLLLFDTVTQEVVEQRISKTKVR
jgi:predicted amidohydrolase